MEVSNLIAQKVSRLHQVIRRKTMKVRGEPWRFGQNQVSLCVYCWQANRLRPLKHIWPLSRIHHQFSLSPRKQLAKVRRLTDHDPQEKSLVIPDATKTGVSPFFSCRYRAIVIKPKCNYIPVNPSITWKGENLSKSKASDAIRKSQKRIREIALKKRQSLKLPSSAWISKQDWASR